MRIVAIGGDITSFSFNPDNCRFRLTLQQTGEFTAATGQFAAATGSFTGTVTAEGLGARDPDGGCALTQPARHEVDMNAASGTLSF